jgi:hypothetical protein
MHAGETVMTKAIELMGLSVYLVEPSGIQAKIILGHLNTLGIVKIRSFSRGEDVLAAMAEARLAAVEDAGVSGICDKPFEPAVVRRILASVLG